LNEIDFSLFGIFVEMIMEMEQENFFQRALNGVENILQRYFEDSSKML